VIQLLQVLKERLHSTVVMFARRQFIIAVYENKQEEPIHSLQEELHRRAQTLCRLHRCPAGSCNFRIGHTALTYDEIGTMRHVRMHWHRNRTRLSAH
jgi:hypothetical protein